MSRQKNLAIIGGVLFLVPFFLGGGFFHLIINWSNWSTEIAVGDKLAAIFFLVLGGGLIIYGLTNRKQKTND